MSSEQYCARFGAGALASAALGTMLAIGACGSPSPVDAPGDGAVVADGGAAVTSNDASPEDASPSVEGGAASDAGDTDADATTVQNDATAPADGGLDAFEGAPDAGPLDAQSESSGGDSLDGADDAVVDAPSYPVDSAPSICGDGVRDPTTEECDNGAGNVDGTGACSTNCQVQDFLAASSVSAIDAGPLLPYQYPGHTLELGRHPVGAGPGGFAVAFLEQEADGDVVLRAEAFSPGGVRVASFPIVGTPSPELSEADPVVAGISATQYAAVWTDPGTAQGGPEIAMAILDTTGGAVGAVVHANAATEFPETAPDALWVGNSLVVAWGDDSGESADIKVATFDGSLNAVSGESYLANTSDDELDVTLAPYNGSWAAAWRASANGFETVHVKAGNVEVVTNQVWGGIEGERPALVQVGPTTLFVAFSVTVSADDGGDGPTTTVLQGAVVDMSAGGPATVTVSEVPLGAQADGGDSRFPEGFPAAVTVGGELWFAAWTGGQAGDPLEDEVWLAPIANGAAAQVGTVVMPMPRWQAHRGGDQESPALAVVAGWGGNAGGAVVGVWEDDGRTLENAAGEDVVVEVVPVPMVRAGN